MKADSIFLRGHDTWVAAWNDGKWIYALLLNFGGLMLLPTNSSSDEKGNGDIYVHPH